MSDLDKMMEKLKKSKDGKEKKPDKQDQEEDQEEQEDDEDQEEESETEEQEEKQEEKVNVNEEVAILQNNGIFRREVLGVLRELINIETIKTQALIDLNKLVGGALNGKKK